MADTKPSPVAVGAVSAVAGGAVGSALTVFMSPPAWALPVIDRMVQELTIMSLILLCLAAAQYWERISKDREWRKLAAEHTSAVADVAIATEKFANASSSAGHTLQLVHDAVASNSRDMQRQADILELVKDRMGDIERRDHPNGGRVDGDR